MSSFPGRWRVAPPPVRIRRGGLAGRRRATCRYRRGVGRPAVPEPPGGHGRRRVQALPARAGRTMFAARIESPHLDWRREGDACRYQVVETPVEVAGPVRRLMTWLRLRYAA